MNKEVIKAMNKKENKFYAIKKWWSKNSYKIMRVVLFPIWFGINAKERITSYLDSHEEWSEERVKEILNYYIPRRSDWDAEDKSFYFFDNGYGWSMSLAKKYLKRKDRRFWDIYSGLSGYKIRSYLIDEFELEGFEKEVGYCSENRTEVVFRMIEKIIKKG